jgi:thioredoxin reductase (NADPH)
MIEMAEQMNIRGLGRQPDRRLAPVILAIDSDADALSEIDATLCGRYGQDYCVECIRSPHEALTRLEQLAAEHHDVALVLAGATLDGVKGSDLLEGARRLHPHARRVLMIAWGEWGVPATGRAIYDSISRGQIEHYVVRPAEPPDELFHHEISGWLLDWAESQRVSPYTINIVGKSWSGRAYELREVLGSCAIPHAFALADSPEGRVLVNRAGGEGGLPIVIFPDGTVLRDPTNAELVEASGAPVIPRGAEFDLVVVGAGPAGLSAAVYGASEGFNTLVVDKGGIGGQATSSSLIRNYLGFARGVSGRRLARDAYEQAWVFGANFAFMQTVTELRRDDTGLTLTLSDSGRVHCRAVLLATGASYQRIGIPALEALNGAGVFYGGTSSEAPAMTDRKAYVVGGANSAGQAALHLARYAARVTLVVRADSLAAGMSHYLVRLVEATPNIEVRVGTEVIDGGGTGRLEHLVLRDRGTGETRTVPADGLFLMIGARPHTDWLPADIVRDEQGFIATGPALGDRSSWPLDRRPLSLETSVPGVFAAGDVRSGSVKRVASSVGEGSVAIQLLHQFFEAHRLRPRGRSGGAVETGETVRSRVP